MSSALESDDECCEHCGQKFGDNDKDAPAASDPIPVARVKPSASVCSPCFYVQRGAFGLSQKELKTKREEHETVAEKFAELRAKHVRHYVERPGKRARHEKVSMEELIRKSESQYVDFQSVSELISLSEYLEKHAKVSKVLRSERERKSYIQNVLGLQVQKDPTKNGALAVAVPKHTLMLSGTRMSSERVKEQRFDSKEESKDAFSKAKAGVEVKLNTKEDMERAEQIAKEEGQGDNSSGSDSDSSSNSSKSSFGLAESEDDKQKGKKKPSKTAGPKSKARRLSDPPSTRLTKKTTPTKSEDPAKVGKAELEKFQGVLDMAEKYLSSLQELKPEILWKSLIRATEVDRKLSREQSVLASLDNALSNEKLPLDLIAKGKKLVTSIGKEIKAVLNLKEFFREVRTTKGVSSQDEPGNVFANLVKPLSSDKFEAGLRLASDPGTLVEVLAFCGKKLHGAGMSLFDFMTITEKEQKCDGFGLQWFISTCPVPDVDKRWKTLLKAQVAIFNDWCDRIRAGASVEDIQKDLPIRLRSTDFDKEKKWLPSPDAEFVVQDIGKAYENQVGLSHTVVVDLQKVFAILDMASMQAGKTIDLKFTAAVAAYEGFSSKISLCVSSQQQWRCLWQKALAVRVEVSVTPATLEDCKAMISKLDAMVSMSVADVTQSDDFENQLAELSGAYQLSQKLHASMVEGAKDGADAIDSALGRLEGWLVNTLCPNYEEQVAHIESFAKEKAQVEKNLEALAERPFPEPQLPPDLTPTFFHLCSVLEKITLPNLKDDAVPRFLLKWQHAMGAFEAPESDCEDSVEVHSMHLGFAKPLLAAAKDEMSHDSLSQAEKPIVEAIVGYMDAFCKIVSAKSVKKILQDPGKSWPIEKLLMPEHMAAGSAFKAVSSLKEDEDAVKKNAGDLAFVLSKLGLFETCANLLQSKIGRDPLLATLATQCESFAATFSKSVRETLKTIQYSILNTMMTYIEKYRKVAKAAEGWEMDGVAWAFSNDESSQSNSDFKVLHGSLTAFRAELSSLETFMSHASGNSEVKKLVDEVAVLTTEGQKLCHEAGAIAAIVMVSGYFIVTEDGVHLDTVQKHCQNMYKFDFAKLPGKLKEMVTKHLKDGPDGADEGRPSKEKKDKKVAKKSKDKGKEKKQSKEKSADDKKSKKVKSKKK